MKTLMKYITLVIFLAVVFAPFNSLGAKSVFLKGNNLTPEEKEFLNTAYTDESRKVYFFKKCAEKFPDAGFTKILNSEQNHVSTLESVYNKYEIDIPKDLDFSSVTIPASKDDVCSTALKMEKDNVEMYKKFLTSVTNTFLKTVFEDLRDITINRNIPAVEKCK
jgi:hypothetical protein